jgi:acetyl esterase
VSRDPEYLAFIRRVVAAAGGAAPVEEQRRAHARGLAGVPRTPVAEQRDVVVDGRLPGRLYRPSTSGPQPGLVFFHGGGWSLGSVEAYDPIVQALAAASGVSFLSVGCRLAPEHPFPAAVEDAIRATRWAQAHAAELGLDRARLGVAGDSSGGNLAAVAARHVDGLAAQVLLYAALDLRTPPQRPPDPDGIEWPENPGVRERYLNGADPSDPDASPLAATSFGGLPPALLVTPEHDALRPQSIAYV